MKYIDDCTVKSLLEFKWDALIKVIECAIVDKHGDMVPKIYLQSGNHGDFRAMPASLRGYSALKWIGVFPKNKQYKLPTTLGTLILSDKLTGETLAVMDCTTLTAYRTAAVSAIAAKHCCPAAKEFTFIGCGLQARYHIEAYEAVFGNRFFIELYDRDEKVMKDLHNWIGTENIAQSWGWNKSVKEACQTADVVTTLTPSTKAYLGLGDVGPKVSHINAIGADAVGKRELKDDIWEKFDLVVDDEEQAAHSGETQYIAGHPHYTLKEVLQGRAPRFRRPNVKEKPTVFDSTGLAIEDIATAILIYEEYCKRN